jgi:hypothetical protein
MTIPELNALAEKNLPDRTEQDQTVFDTYMAAWWAALKDDFEPDLNTITAAINAASSAMNDNVTDAEAAQAAAELAETNAETAQSAAETARDAAANYANATIYDPGTTYDAGDVVLDPGDSYKPYISQQAENTGNTPNTDDRTWWESGLSDAFVAGQIILGPPDQSFDGFLEMDGSTVLAASYPNLAGFDLLKSFPFAEATSSATVVSANNINAVCYGGTKFVCVGNIGVIAFSTDGDTWTAAASSGSVPGTTLCGVCYGGTKYVAVGLNNDIAFSEDGDTWTEATDSSTLFAGTEELRAVCYGDSKFVCVGDGGVIGYSADGDNWTVATSSGTPPDLYGVTYDATIGKFVAVGLNDIIYYSADGDTWTIATYGGALEGSDKFNAIASDGTNFVAAGDYGLSGYSSDGDNWTQIKQINFGSYEIDVARSVFGITYGSNLFVAVGDNGYVWYSTDGKGWFQLSDRGANLNSVCFGDSKFVCVGSNGKIYYGAVSATNLYLPPLNQPSGFSAYIKY